MTFDNETIKAMFEYIALISKENSNVISWAWIHGWRANEEDIKKGEELREIIKLAIDREYYLEDRPICSDADYETIFGGNMKLLEVKKDDSRI